jgi:polyhydroxyalkanoate synthase
MADAPPPGAPAPGPPPPPDPAEIARTFAELSQRSAQLVTRFFERAGQDGGVLADELGVGRAFAEAIGRLWTDPVQLARVQMNLWNDYLHLCQSAWMRMLGLEAPAVASPGQGDRRFRHEDWEHNFVFDFIKQSYLIAASHLHRTLANIDGLDDPTRRKVDFYTRQYIDALAPTNFLLTNPEVLRETFQSGGRNLIKGLDNLLLDLERGGGRQLRIRMTDSSQFRLGVNIATTPGKVVYQNELMQLIQYAPSTAKVLRRPLLIIPPWINKFYILDLREKNSFIKWAVDHGHTVFVVSWVNPDERLAHKSFESYLVEGPLAALDAVREATGEPDANVIGYCLGGTLLACLLAWLAARGEARRIASATFFTAMIDFDEGGELEVFIDEQQLDRIEQRMESRGYLEGHEMAVTFNMLRANDLIWSFVVNNYLMGRDPLPFDLLHWNSDSTRMPAAMHSYYLRNMYLKNRLREPGALELAGVPIDVRLIETPAYFLSTIEDHIAPWKSTYAGARLLSGPVRFTLAGSGHIAGVINPPAARKYCHWVNERLPETPEQWFETATQREGSWWPDWQAWVSAHGGGEVEPRIPGAGPLPALEDAPGSYVQVSVEAQPAGELGRIARRAEG